MGGEQGGSLPRCAAGRTVVGAEAIATAIVRRRLTVAVPAELPESLGGNLVRERLLLNRSGLQQALRLTGESLCGNLRILLAAPPR